MFTQLALANHTAGRAPAQLACAADDKALLIALIKRMSQDPATEAVRYVLLSLNRLIESLRAAEARLLAPDGPAEAVPIFSTMCAEMSDLIDFIDVEVLTEDATRAELADALACLSFGLRHELRRVIDGDLAGLYSARQPEPTQADVVQAHGLLLNCFQQSVITLAQAFDPALAGAYLFNDLQLKREHSIKLIAALEALLDAGYAAGKESYPRSLLWLTEQLESFRREHLRYLLFRDWREYEQFMDEIMIAHDQGTLTAALHKFETYLTTLLGHVRMRAVLSEQPPGQQRTGRMRTVLSSINQMKGLRATAGTIAAGLTLVCLVSSLPVRQQGGGLAQARGAAPTQQAAQVQAGGARSSAGQSFAPPVSGGRLVVQVGSYPDSKLAVAQAARLATAGVGAEVMQAEVSGWGTRYRVLAGRFGSRAEATRFGAGLQQRGAVQNFIVTKLAGAD